MQSGRVFWLPAERPRLEQALKSLGFDLVNDPAEPNLIQARRDRGGDVSIVIVDHGGRLRYTRTRQTSPERSVKRRASSYTFQATRQASETVTVSLDLAADATQDLTALLAALAQV